LADYSCRLFERWEYRFDRNSPIGKFNKGEVELLVKYIGTEHCGFAG